MAYDIEVGIMSNAFLGGPISNVICRGVFDKKIKKEIESVKKILLECKGYDEVLSAYFNENFGKKPPSIKKMFNKDEEWIYKAKHAYFVISYDKRKCLPRTDGSYIEIGICYAKNIPITIISDAPKKDFPTMLKSMIKNKKVEFIALAKFLNNIKRNPSPHRSSK